MQREDQRIIVITGASSGIGRELAIQLAAPGRRIWLVARDETRLEEVADAVRAAGAEARVAKIDLQDRAAAGGLLAGDLAAETRIDELYLLAAVSLFGEVKDLFLEDWQQLYRTNFLSIAQWIAAIYPRMVRQRAGRVVIFSSLAGYAGYPTSTPYASMKSGLLGLYRSLVHEARPYGVNVHLVAPGYVETAIYKNAIYRGTSCEATLRHVREMGFRMISPQRAAALTLAAIRRGRNEIIYPGYARAFAWLSSRVPLFLNHVHSRVLREFRKEVRS